MSDSNCTCGAPREGALAMQTRAISTRVGARVDPEVARVLVNYCSRVGNCSTSEGIRRAIVALAASTATPEDQTLEAIREVLGLEPESNRAAIIEAIDHLFSVAGDGADAAQEDGLSETPEVAPASPTGFAKLTSEQRAALKRRKMPETVGAWKKLTASMVRVAGAAPARADVPAVEVPRAFTAQEIAWGDRNKVPRDKLRATLAERAKNAVRKL
jgi:hypothetical protein